MLANSLLLFLVFACPTTAPRQSEQIESIDAGLDLVREEEWKKAKRQLKKALKVSIAAEDVAARLAEIYRAAIDCEIGLATETVDLEEIFRAEKVKLNRRTNVVEFEPEIRRGVFGGTLVFCNEIQFTDSIELKIGGKLDKKVVLDSRTIELCIQDQKKITLLFGVPAPDGRGWYGYEGVITRSFDGNKGFTLESLDESPLTYNGTYRLDIRINNGRYKLRGNGRNLFSIPLERNAPLGGFRISISGLKSVEVEGSIDSNWLHQQEEEWRASKRFAVVQAYDPEKILPDWLIELGGLGGPGSTLARLELPASDFELVSEVARMREAGDMDSAFEVLSGADSSPRAEYLNGLLHSDLGMLDEAGRFLERASKAEPSIIEVGVLSQRILALQGDVAAAIPELVKLAKDSTAPSATYEAALWLFRAGASTQARVLMLDSFKRGLWSPELKELQFRANRAGLTREDRVRLIESPSIPASALMGKQKPKNGWSMALTKTFFMVANAQEKELSAFLELMQGALERLIAIRPLPKVVVTRDQVRVDLFSSSTDRRRLESDSSVDLDWEGWSATHQRILLEGSLDKGLDRSAYEAIVDLYLARSWLGGVSAELREALVEAAAGSSQNFDSVRQGLTALAGAARAE